ncbi:MAG: ATP-binding protein [Deltaproteobacteria bacterium]|nr:ATP-binding protein [Deltaproteobacteria bacterium]
MLHDVGLLWTVALGLGLSLSFDLARRYGGTLRATPRPGGGTSFTLWLPASADASA